MDLLEGFGGREARYGEEAGSAALAVGPGGLGAPELLQEEKAVEDELHRGELQGGPSDGEGEPLEVEDDLSLEEGQLHLPVSYTHLTLPTTERV